MSETSHSLPFHRRRNGRAVRRTLLAGIATALFALAPAAAFAQHGFEPEDDDGDDVVSQEMQPPVAVRGSLVQGASRVTHPEPASTSQWSSMAFIEVRTASGQTAACGGTVIVDRWILTAGHCVAGRGASDFTVIEGVDNLTAGGHRLRVDRVVVHDRFTDQPPRYDIALLHLASPAQSPPQPLIGSEAARTMLGAGTPAAIAGFGLTTPQPVSGAHNGTLSNRLMQTRLAVVARSDCARVLAGIFGLPASGVTFIGESTVCAADPADRGGDACFGDSGGPLALDIDRSRVQAGVVSWGPGCGQHGTVGVYTSVGYFENWIRGYVPNAIFVGTSGPPPEHPTLVDAAAAPAGATAASVCGLPAVPLPRVKVAIAEGSRPPIGTAIHIGVTPGVTGQLMVFNVNTESCRTFQVYPNPYSGSGAIVPAGATVSIPAGNAFVIRAAAPAGPNRLYAVVVPPDAPIRDLVTRGIDMRTSTDAPSLWRELSARIVQSSGRLQADPIGVYAYEIVP